MFKIKLHYFDFETTRLRDFLTMTIDYDYDRFYIKG